MEKVEEERRKRGDDLRIREKLEIVVPMIESGSINNLLFQDDFQTYQDHYRELLNITEEYGYMIVIEFGDAEEKLYVLRKGSSHIVHMEDCLVLIQIKYIFWHI